MVMDLKDTIPELCFLRGIYCYSRQDFLGLEKEIGRLLGTKNVQDERKQREVYLNLLFLNPLCSLEEWLSVLERMELKRRGKSIICMECLGVPVLSCAEFGIWRDFLSARTGNQSKGRSLETNAGEREWRCYCLARIDYEVETDRKDSLSEEDQELLLEDEKMTTGRSGWRKCIFYASCRHLARMKSERSELTD